MSEGGFFRLAGKWFLAPVILLLLQSITATAQQPVSDAGNLYPVLEAYAARDNSSLSYLAKDWKNTEKWRKEARGKLHELLAFAPEPAPLNPQIFNTTKRDEIGRAHV